LPIFVFFAQGFEHSIVNMFLIPTGMMMGAEPAAPAPAPAPGDSESAEMEPAA